MDMSYQPSLHERFFNGTTLLCLSARGFVQKRLDEGSEYLASALEVIREIRIRMPRNKERLASFPDDGADERIKGINRKMRENTDLFNICYLERMADRLKGNSGNYSEISETLERYRKELPLELVLGSP